MLLVIVLAAVGVVHAISPELLRLGPQGVNLWKLDQKTHQHTRRLLVQETSGFSLAEEFPAQWFEQPLDHFDEGIKDTFMQRYWVNKRHYDPTVGGPVIVLDGGETSGEDRLPYLDTGIVEILCNATGGVGVVLEHRYYGESIATQNLTTDSLRFLNNDQAAADSANFMSNVKFAGIDEDLTAPGTAWIYYGGSYAGARSAHMRILYPDIVFGAIASSAVTHAAISNWEYMDVIRKAADPTCSKHLQNSVETIDAILAHDTHGLLAKPLKALFGIHDLKHDVDFVSLIESPLGSWQSKNWDPAVGSTAFDQFCEAINKPVCIDVTSLEFGHPDRLVNVTDGLTVDMAIVNYGNYIKENVANRCPQGNTQEECFGTFDDSQYTNTSLAEDWRLWQFQVCTQWGYFTTAPPDPAHPRIISRLLDLEYESKICRQAYPPGEKFTVPELPNIASVNMLGSFDAGRGLDRLAFIDGEVDPWRPDTPHSDYARPREDTILMPFKLIPGAVHHWDENGLPGGVGEPPEIKQIHEEEVEFVTAWLKDF
ncbi:peptidase S28 [Dendrothele bispora CBS 962.96]|uniref:Peptidase S28 n=1 Tax=Dendrothele bispora (strain CBS 962.96) TaxID=1314807 RepID=A0A4S8M4J5_DENBC|nr:peptidase S28 [Dendrothele bispora CBS 962.96]